MPMIMGFQKYDSDTEQIIFFKNKDKSPGSSVLIDHKLIFHIPPKSDIWRYKGWLDEDFIVDKK